MTYAVKELFYTLQGEGQHAGRPAVFLRFAGCNLWSGREQDRETGSGGCARWCDTDFVGTNGVGGGKFATPAAIATAVTRAWPSGEGRKFVVCTGGEPLLQLDDALVAALHGEGFTVAIETNGTKPVPLDVDWICVSPKVGGQLVVHSGHELKLVYPQPGLEPASLEALVFEHYLLQPLDGPDRAANTRLAIDYCLAHPRWRLSIQSHKYLGIP